MTRSATFKILFWSFIVLLICFRIHAAFTLPMNGDEGSDFQIVGRDTNTFVNFFDERRSANVDQARLPHIVAAAVMAVMGTTTQTMFDHLGIVRLVFLLFHVAYLVCSFYIISNMAGSRTPAYLYVFLLATSCYLAAYSIGVMSTGETVYVLFHLLSIWLFYNNFKSGLQRDGAFKQYLLLILVMAACIAGKLFGSFLLVSMFIFHALNVRSLPSIKIAAPSPGILWLAATGFLLVITTINLLPIDRQAKAFSAVGLAVLYVGGWAVLVLMERAGRFQSKPIGFLHFWTLFTVCCFNLVLVLSPIYLNLKNLLKIFTWFNTWTPEKIHAESDWLGAVKIVVLKFGIVPSLLLIPATIIAVSMLLKYSKNHPGWFKQSIYFLLFCTILIHLAVISYVHLKLPWHSLAIFPFLYLPFVLTGTTIKTHRAGLLKAALVLLLVAVPADNLYRYFYWYPNSHFDGGQYGQNYIGINKPCLITFEALPELYEYLKTSDQIDINADMTINVQGSDSRILNNYFRSMLKLYFKSKGYTNINFQSLELYEDSSDLILTSPLYNSEYEKQLLQFGFRKIQAFNIAKVVIGNLWQPPEQKMAGVNKGHSVPAIN